MRTRVCLISCLSVCRYFYLGVFQSILKPLDTAQVKSIVKLEAVALLKAYLGVGR
jgi:hypothetical protein